MTSQPPAVDADREHRLIEQLELRIASANTDDKFSSVVQKFLAALVLKVGSEHVRNRNLAIKVCQHVSQRLKLDNSIALPVQPLLKTFYESQSAFVSRFALMFIEQGLSRLPQGQRSTLLPEVLQKSIPENEGFDAVRGKMWSVAFDFLLDVLRTWRVPDRATREETELKDLFHLTDKQSGALSDMLSNFIAYDLKTKSAWKKIPQDFEPVFEKHTKTRSQVIAGIAKFLSSPVFSDNQRFTSAVLLSVDANDTASGVADVMFKQCEFDMESESSIDILFRLFDSGRPKLQIRVLSLLSKSQNSTKCAAKILEIVEQQLFRDGAGLEAAKLRSLVFQYLNWAVRVSNDLSPVKEKLQTSLREYIELQGWPVMSQGSPVLAELRAKAYESIGLLASIKSSIVQDGPTVSLDLLTWLFTSLRCDTTKDTRASVDEALSRMLNIAKFTSSEDIKTLKDLLLWNAKAQEGDQDPTYYFTSVNSTRYLAVRFANKVLPFDDVDARYIDLLAIGLNDRREVIEEGSRGLDPYWHITSARLSTGLNEGSDFKFPNFDSFAACVFQNADNAQSLQSQVSSLAAAVKFGRNLLANEALRKAQIEVEVDGWERKLDALIENDVSARSSLKTYISRADPSAITPLLENAIFGMSKGSSTCAEIALELISLSSSQTLHQLNPGVIKALHDGCLNNTVQSQATRVFGIVSSLSNEGNSMVRQSLLSCASWSSAVGQDAISVRAALLCAGYTLTRLALRGSTAPEADLVDELYALVSSIILKSHDKSLVHAAYIVIGEMCLCLPPSTKAFTENTKLLDSLMADAKKEDELAVRVLGRVASAMYSSETSKSVNELLERLYGLHEIRKAELHFALGEALTTAALGFHSQSTLSDFDVDASKPEWGYQPDLLRSILDRSITDSKTTKPSLKKASAIWLLSIMQYCEDATLLKPRLRDCQAAFARLLNDRDEIVQETGSRGLGLVYEKGDKSLRDDLVRDLVQSFTGGNAKMSGTVNEDTELFEAGTLPTEGGQSVQTYKDIVSLATEMGDPSLVYRFMNLASSNAIWTSRAAFGRFGLSGVLADSAYLTENKKFYPKLFRYRFDPNPNVQRSMDDIWKALVKDSNKVIDENFDLIMTDLLKSIISGKDWRAREASCAAISDLVQGREVEKFESYLNEIWNVAFKVLDDVKETVRVAAMKFCRTLTGMLIRNLEVGEGTTKRATTMMQHAIPFLLQQMEGGSAQEVQQYAVVTLLEIVKKSPPRSLRPYAPKILERLVLSLSSLEHESINYLHLNADKYGLTAEKLDKMRVSSINASPVSEAIEKCLESLFSSNANEADKMDHAVSADDGVETTNGELPPAADAMRRLETAFKTAIGLPSKVGLSRVMITLVVRHHTAFRAYADRFLQLTRKHILDRNATISISFSMALGYLVRLASHKEVNETSRYAQKLYFESQELAHRAVAGEIIQAVSKASNDVFMNFASTFLAFAFIGRNDLDPDVRDRFDPPWKDNVGGSRALNLYLPEIVGLISEHIKSNLWPIKQACCLAVAELTSSMEGTEQYSEAEARLLWHVVEEALNGKTWKGKEKVVSAYPIFVKRARVLWDEKGKQMRAMALREAKRTNVAYRPHALTALGEVASTRPDLELDQEVLQVLTNVVDEMEEQENAMEVDVADGGEEQGSSARHAEATSMAVIVCLFQILTPRSRPDVLDQALNLVKRAHGKMSAKIDVEIYNGARRYITQATRRGGLPSLSSRSSVNASASASLSANADVREGQVRSSPTAGEGDRQPQGAGHVGARQHEEEQGPQAQQAQQAQQEQCARFLHGLVLALFDADDCARRHASDQEGTRKSRADLALALVESGMLIQPAAAALAASLKICIQGERSRPLKTDLEKALNALAA